MEVFEEVCGREFEYDWGRAEFVEQTEFYDMELEEAGYDVDELRLLESRRKPKTET